MITATATAEESTLGRKAVFGIVCGTHFVNHFQSAMLGVIYPLMMKDLGMGYLAIASLATVYNTLGSVFQALYGFVVPYVRRGVILGVGNCVLGLSVIGSGFASSFQQFFATRLLGGLGSSPQHPIGSSMLASYFNAARGRALAFHSTAGQIGSLVAPLLAALLIFQLGWRGVFWAVGIVTTIMGMICFVFRDSLRLAVSDKAKSRLTPVGWDAYKKCLQNKNVLLVSLLSKSAAWPARLFGAGFRIVSTENSSFKRRFWSRRSPPFGSPGSRRSQLLCSPTLSFMAQQQRRDKR